MIDTTSQIHGLLKYFCTTMIDVSEATFFGALTLRDELTEDKILNEEI